MLIISYFFILEYFLKCQRKYKNYFSARRPTIIAKSELSLLSVRDNRNSKIVFSTTICEQLVKQFFNRVFLNIAMGEQTKYGQLKWKERHSITVNKSSLTLSKVLENIFQIKVIKPKATMLALYWQANSGRAIWNKNSDASRL